MLLAATTKIKHGLLCQFIEERGWSQNRLAKEMNIQQATVNRWFNLQDYPKNHETVAKVCAFLDKEMWEVWPEEIIEAINKKYFKTKVLTQYKEIPISNLLQEQKSQLRIDGDVVSGSHEQEELRIVIDEILCALSFREKSVLRKRFGFDGNEETLEAQGADFRVTRERVRQIEVQALEKL